MWELKDMKIKPTLSYKIKESAPAYTPVTDKCRLCLLEKLEILLADEKKYINIFKMKIYRKSTKRNISLIFSNFIM